MTNIELIRMLSELPGDSEVRIVTDNYGTSGINTVELDDDIIYLSL